MKKSLLVLGSVLFAAALSLAVAPRTASAQAAIAAAQSLSASQSVGIGGGASGGSVNIGASRIPDPAASSAIGPSLAVGDCLVPESDGFSVLWVSLSHGHAIPYTECNLIKQARLLSEVGVAMKNPEIILWGLRVQCASNPTVWGAAPASICPPPAAVAQAGAVNYIAPVAAANPAPAYVAPISQAAPVYDQPIYDDYRQPVHHAPQVPAARGSNETPLSQKPLLTAKGFLYCQATRSYYTEQDQSCPDNGWLVSVNGTWQPANG